MVTNALGIYEKAICSFLSWEEKLLLAKDSGFDFVEEPGGFLFRAVEAGCQAIIRIIGQCHSAFQGVHRRHHHNGQEHFLLPQMM